MSIKLNYIGDSNYRVIKRTDITAAGMADPGADLIFAKANGYQLNVSNDVALWLTGMGEFLPEGAVNFGSAYSIIGGSGVVLASVLMSSQMTMAAAGVTEDVVGTTTFTFTYDGRPIFFETTPLAIAVDVAQNKLMTMAVKRSSDSAVQRTFYTQNDAAQASALHPLKVQAGPFTAWPSDGVPFVPGTVYGAKLAMGAGSGAKASHNGNTQPFTFMVRTA